MSMPTNPEDIPFDGPHAAHEYMRALLDPPVRRSPQIPLEVYEAMDVAVERGMPVGIVVPCPRCLINEVVVEVNPATLESDIFMLIEHPAQRGSLLCEPCLN